MEDTEAGSVKVDLYFFRVDRLVAREGITLNIPER